jgi:hypothetical protein
MTQGVKIFGCLLNVSDLEIQSTVLKNTLPETLTFIEFNVFDGNYASLFDEELTLEKKVG